MSTPAIPAKLIIAVPSKGRLQENTMSFFARAGLSMAQEGGSRDYRGSLRSMPGVEILFQSASEIVAKLASGETHFGVTGEDLIREAMPDADRQVVMLSPLGFGHADVVVAVPKGWIDAASMEDIEEIAADFHSRHGRRMRVATKYVNLTRMFFAQHGVADYRIVESLGATEGAPASGSAEFIVDITTTGSTLEANGLKVLEDGVMLRSQANLVASLSASWSEPVKVLARQFLSRLSAEQTGRTTRTLRMTAEPAHVAAIMLHLEKKGGAVDPVDDQQGARRKIITAQVPAHEAPALAASCIEHGATQAIVSEAQYVFRSQSPLFETLSARLPVFH